MLKRITNLISKMEIIPIPCLEDNYAYLIIEKSSRKAAVIDPVEPAKVLAQAHLHQADLQAIWATHHHLDHTGGNEDIIKLEPGIRVFGFDERIPGLTDKVKHHDTFKLGDTLNVTCIHNPCHTTGSISYFVESSTDIENSKAVFTGDTLFSAGCGRFFEGTGAEMFQSLIEKLSALPDDTRVYFGHEYTKSNLKFALSVEPGNANVQKAYEESLVKTCTVPSTIAKEKLINPFMRVKEQSVLKAMDTSDPIEAMTKLRQRKNEFK